MEFKKNMRMEFLLKLMKQGEIELPDLVCHIIQAERSRLYRLLMMII